jgi:hypothetical protein
MYVGICVTLLFQKFCDSPALSRRKMFRLRLRLLATAPHKHPHLNRSLCTWKDDIETAIEEIRCQGVASSERVTSQDRVKWRTVVNRAKNH